MSPILPKQAVTGFTSGIRILQRQLNGSFTTAKFCFSESSFFGWYLKNILNPDNDIYFLHLLSELNHDGCLFLGCDYVVLRDVFIVCDIHTPKEMQETVMALKRSELKHKLIASRKGWSTKF